MCCRDCVFFRELNDEYGTCDKSVLIKFSKEGQDHILVIYNSTPACGRFKNNVKGDN